MLADFDKACGKIGLRLNLTETMYVKNGLVSYAPFALNGTNISECSSYIYLGREINIMNDLAPELNRRKRAAWGSFKSIKDVVKRTRNTQLCAHFFEPTVLPALTYASEICSLPKHNERSLSVIERAVERAMLGVSRVTQASTYLKLACIRRKLHKYFATKISTFHNDINNDVKRGVRQGIQKSDTISPKLFTATLQNVMPTLEWDNMGVKIDGRQLHHLRFADDDIVLITPNIIKAEQMHADFDKACGTTKSYKSHVVEK
ncbi:unnamed protein product [Angiostrongylus costaricensis]|uniref:Reverse transcriptase domain-containing protein n=1 Tax=Angiostrongylus costaricensis TaxID=334426 RepID=A0A0R3PJK6_ANGCS|nr:unnamed protein product [Angiostrongylus costaricensis]